MELVQTREGEFIIVARSQNENRAVSGKTSAVCRAVDLAVRRLEERARRETESSAEGVQDLVYFRLGHGGSRAAAQADDSSWTLPQGGGGAIHCRHAALALDRYVGKRRVSENRGGRHGTLPLTLRRVA